MRRHDLLEKKNAYDRNKVERLRAEAKELRAQSDSLRKQAERLEAEAVQEVEKG